ncbi:MAG: hypothetical protein IPO40_05945 [Fibrobacteres bacterium]|nr:hypothetical protein [Fibrobacterota bacterium]
MIPNLFLLLRLFFGASMDNTVGIIDLVKNATSIVVIKPMNPDGSHDWKSTLYTASPRPLPAKLRIQARSTAILSKLPNKGEGKHLFVDTPREKGLRCDRTKNECIAFLYDSDEWNLYSFTSDVECAPLSKLAEVNKAIAAKLANSLSSTHFTELSLEEFLQIPSHILVVEPQSPAQAKHTTPAIVPDGRPFEYTTDRYTVVETLRAKGTRPVPSSIEVREFDQHARERWSIANQNLSFSAAMLEGATTLPAKTGRRIILVWEHAAPGHYVYIARQASLPIAKLAKVRELAARPEE